MPTIIIDYEGAQCVAKGTWFAWRPVRAIYPDKSIKYVWWRTLWWKKFDPPLCTYVYNTGSLELCLEIYLRNIEYYVVPTP